ncbi:MAG TPA: hypothetical protein DCS63_06925 [Elusimicrobia bacterium]|nr:hypothetical protein [Elusimicrobiota bacterium]
MDKLKVLAALWLLALAPAAGNCGWTPFKLELSGSSWAWPEDVDTVAGLNLNFSGDTPEIYGLQFGVLNGAGTVGGAQLGLWYNYVTGAVYGLQSSPARNFADYQYGVQFGGWNVSNEAWGVQAAWLRNWAGLGNGVMAAPVNVVKDRMRGIQLGFYNVTDGDMSGLQLGAVNICRGTLKGVQIGVANIGGKNALLPVTIGLNAGF